MEDLVVPKATEPYGRAVWGRARPEGRPETPPLCCTAPPHGTPALIEQTKKSHRSLGLGNVHTHLHAHTCVHVYTRCTLVCVHTHMCSCVLMYTRYMLVCAHIHVCTCVHSWVHTPIHANAHTSTNTCPCVCTHIHANIPAPVHMYTHTSTHTRYTHTRVQTYLLSSHYSRL